MQDGCVMCGVEAALVARGRELRQELRQMAPRTPESDALFGYLVENDRDLRMLQGRMRTEREEA